MDEDVLLFTRFLSTSKQLHLMSVGMAQETDAVSLFTAQYPFSLADGCTQGSAINYQDITNAGNFSNPLLAFKTYFVSDCLPQQNGCTCSDGYDIRVMNINSGQQHLLMHYQKNGSVQTPSKPSIRKNFVTWSQEGEVYRCDLTL